VVSPALFALWGADFFANVESQKLDKNVDNFSYKLV
jgi:hypothetical protein